MGQKYIYIYMAGHFNLFDITSADKGDVDKILKLESTKKKKSERIYIVCASLDRKIKKVFQVKRGSDVGAVFKQCKILKLIPDEIFSTLKDALKHLSKID